MARPAKDYLRREPNGKYVLRFQYNRHQRFIARVLCNVELDANFRKRFGTDLLEAREQAITYVRWHLRLLLLARANKNPPEVEADSWGEQVPCDALPENFDQLRNGVRVRNQNGIAIADDEDGRFVYVGKSGSASKVIWSDYAKRQPEYKAYMQQLQKVTNGGADPNRRIIEQYIKHRDSAHDEIVLFNKALDDWNKVHGRKPFHKASRAEARAFQEYIHHGRGTGRTVSVGRVERITSVLRAAITFEMSDNKLTTKFRENIFEKQPVRRLPGEKISFKRAYDDNHIRTMIEHRADFSDEEWLMIVVHVSMGIRPIAVWSISFDFEEPVKDTNGVVISAIRAFYVDHDKDKKDAVKKYGPRALPFAQAVLDAKKLDGSPLLPAKVEGTLFPSEKRLKPFLQRIRYKLKKIAVNDGDLGIVFYSGRHRADQKMGTKVPKYHQSAIRGHARKLDAMRKTKDSQEMYGRRDYGHKFTMAELKPSVDAIGFP